MSDLAELTERLAPAIGLVIEQEVERRVGELEVRRNHKSHDRDAKIMAACGKIADAVEGVQQARFAGGPEIPARKRLERACNDLYKVMRGRPR